MSTCLAEMVKLSVRQTISLQLLHQRPAFLVDRTDAAKHPRSYVRGEARSSTQYTTVSHRTKRTASSSEDRYTRHHKVDYISIGNC